VAIIAMYCHFYMAIPPLWPQSCLLNLSWVEWVELRPLMPHCVCDWLKQNKIVRVGKKSDPVLSRLWTKFHEIFGQRRRTLVLSKPLRDCLCHVSFSGLEVVEKLNKCKGSLAPIFFREGRPQLFYGRLLARFTIHRLAKFGRVPFADLHLRSLTMKCNAEFTEGG